jgi:hypothetical protein
MNLVISAIEEANAFHPVSPGAKYLAHGANIKIPVLLMSLNDLKHKRGIISLFLNIFIRHGTFMYL